MIKKDSSSFYMSDQNDSNLQNPPTSESSETEVAEATDEQINTPTARCSPSESSGTKYQVASLAAILAAPIYRDSTVLSRPGDMSNPNRDEFFYGALRRAKWLLEEASNPAHNVYAFQVFKEAEDYSAGEIARKFKEIGWDGLYSINTIKSIMGELRHLMENLPLKLAADRETSRNSNSRVAISLIRKSLDRLGKDEKIKSAFGNFEMQSTRFIAALERRTSYAFIAEILRDPEWHKAFLKWCFEDSPKGTRYRPHEIFRMAALEDWLHDQLIVSNARLIEDYIPIPKERLSSYWFEKFMEEFDPGEE